MAPSTAKEAYVTLCTNDSYAIGVLVWAESLREVGTTRQIVVMVTNGLSQKMKEQLEESADKVVEVNVLDSRDNVNLDLLARPDLGVTFTKLHCWRLTEYDKCVFMDADTLVLKNIDDLFEKEEFSASPDPGWPDCFNSGVYVFKPSLETYQKLLKFAVKSGSFDGGDQGLLNSYYSNWNRISFLYNCVAQSFYSYLPAFKQFGKDVKVAHFIGAVKPWHHSFDVSTGKVSESEFSGHCANFLRHWWNLFINKIHKRLPEEIMRTRSQSLNIVYSDLNTDDSQRRFLWEQGQIDYMGIDKFDNIQKKLDSMMVSQEPAKPKHSRKRDKRPSSRGSSEKSSTVTSEEHDSGESKSTSDDSKEGSIEKQSTNRLKSAGATSTVPTTGILKKKLTDKTEEKQVIKEAKEKNSVPAPTAKVGQPKGVKKGSKAEVSEL